VNLSDIVCLLSKILVFIAHTSVWCNRATVFLLRPTDGEADPAP
jgi:hypothetical protein